MKPTPFHHFASLLGQKSTTSIQVCGAAIDSRLIKKGDLFFALTGNKSDGHTFLRDVALKGAAGAIVHEEYEGDSFGLDLLRVPDVVRALQDMARETLERRESKVLAITGSLGKTTTKEFAATLLATKYRLSKSPLSYNSKVTLPLSVLLGDDQDELIILEMGMSEKGEIAKLVSIAPPDIACLTTVSLQHSDGFSDGLLGIANEKGQIFSHPKTKKGFLFSNTPHRDVVDKIGSCSKATFALDGNADTLGTIMEGGIQIDGHFIPLKLPLKAHYQNFLAAVCCTRELGVSWEAIQKAACNLKLPPMRFEILQKEGITFVNDAYNANPESVKAALKELPQPQSSGKKIAVLSEMNALGLFTEKGHEEVAQVALEHVDLLLCLGKNCITMKNIWEKAGKECQHFENKKDLAESLKKCAHPGDVVLLKGARAWGLDELLLCYYS